MAVLLIGANPGVLLYQGDERVAFASVWDVEWSHFGAGQALVLWEPAKLRLIGQDSELTHWLFAYFTRNFPELAGVRWPEAELTIAPVDIELDLAVGMRATAGPVRVEISEPLDRRPVHVTDFALEGGTPHGLSTVYTPCAQGRIVVDGAAIQGEPKVQRVPLASSTAYLAPAEVWWTVEGPAD